MTTNNIGDVERNISNIKVSDRCYTELKVISLRKKIRLQELITTILEEFVEHHAK